MIVLKQTYTNVDTTISQKPSTEQFGLADYPLRTGTTSTTVVVTGTHVVVAHIGDSKAILMRDSKLEYETRAHTVDEAEEKQRIERTSAVIKEFGGVGYVYDPAYGRRLGPLGMTRAFGDFHL